MGSGGRRESRDRTTCASGCRPTTPIRIGTGAWRPQHREFQAWDLPVEGTVPDDLEGVYLRNTETALFEPIRRYHPFDGDGLVHSMSFANGEAQYASRFVRTAGVHRRASCQAEPVGRNRRASVVGSGRNGRRRSIDDEGQRQHRRGGSRWRRRLRASTSAASCIDSTRARSRISARRAGMGGFPTRACRPIRRSMSARASFCSSTTRTKRRT